MLKVCLIFSPFSSFSYIPLGISYLKSFLRKNIPGIHVKNIDVSNDFYHQMGEQKFLIDLLRLCEICPKRGNAGCKGMLRSKDFLDQAKAISALKNFLINSDTGYFFNTDKYNRSRRMYDIFYSGLMHCIKAALEDYIKRQPEADNRIEKILLQNDVNRIVSEKPDVIGFSIFSESQLYYSLALARVLKKKTGAFIVFGGAYISHLDKRKLLENFDFMDFIIYKEGELGFAILIKNIDKKDLGNVPNLVYRKGGKIIENKESCVSYLDKIPFPDFGDYNMRGYFTTEPVVSTLFSRGCFWGRCAFCAHRKTYSQPYRRRTVQNLVMEFEQYKRMGIKHVWFSDEIISAKDMLCISNGLLDKNAGIFYGVMLRPTKDFTFEILRKMYESGCRVAIWGVESFNQRVLDLMNKGTKAEDIENVLKTSHKAGLANMVYMMQGFPTQSEQEIIEDIKKLNENLEYVYYFGMHLFWLEEDTEVFRNFKKFGLTQVRKKYLFKSKNAALSSSYFSFKGNAISDKKKINRLMQKNCSLEIFKKFQDSGLFYNKEHILLHLAG